MSILCLSRSTRTQVGICRPRQQRIPYFTKSRKPIRDDGRLLRKHANGILHPRVGLTVIHMDQVFETCSLPLA